VTLMKIVFNGDRQLVISSFGTTEAMALDLWKERAKTETGFKEDAFIFETYLPKKKTFQEQSGVQSESKKNSPPAKPPRDGSGKVLYCSFCGKTQHEIQKLIAGPSVYICDECVALCNDIIGEELYNKASE
jgi:hypothetical protein